MNKRDFAFKSNTEYYYGKKTKINYNKYLIKNFEYSFNLVNISIIQSKGKKEQLTVFMENRTKMRSILRRAILEDYLRITDFKDFFQ